MKPILYPYLAALCSTFVVTAQAQKVTDPINDCAIFAALCEQGGRLMEDGKGIAAETLRGQLVRTHCEFKLSSTPATKPMTAAEIYAAACDSIIVVSGVAKFGKDPKWQANPATAFSIGEPDVFVTNYHVFNETQSLGFVGMTRQGEIQPVTEILAASRVNDIVIFRAPGLGRRPLTLRDDAPAGTSVAVIGHPDGHFFSLSQGTIARHALAHYAGLASAGHRLEGLMPVTPNSESRCEMDITADYAGGASGAPILDDCGNVVGLAATTQTVVDERNNTTTLQMVFKHCIPAASLRGLMEPTPKPKN